MLKCLFGILFSAGLVLVGLSAHSIIDENDILVFWSFDELDGDMFKDESDNGYDAKLGAGGKLVEGKIGNAVHLSGGAIVTLGPSNILEPVVDTGEITMEASVFLNQAVNGNANFPYDGIISDNTAQFRMMLEGPDAHPYWNVGNRADKRFRGFKFKEDKWYHFIVLGDNENSKVYIDGVLVATAAQAPGFKMTQKPVQVVTIFIGAGEAAAVWTVEDAIIDEVAIYNKVLTEDEINDLKERGLGAVLKAVEPRGKLASRWAEIKVQRQ